MDEKDKLISAEKEIVRLKERIKKLEEDKTTLNKTIENEQKIYQRLENGACDREGNRLFKVSITFWDTCGHGYSSVICEDLLVAKLVEQALKSLFKGKVSVETTTKQELRTDDNTWIFV